MHKIIHAENKPVVEQFESWLVKKGRKASTVYTYREALKSIDNMVDGKPLLSLTVDDVIMLKNTMPLAECSRKLYLIALGRLFEANKLPNIVKEANLLWNSDSHTRKFIKKSQFKSMMDIANSKDKLILMFGAYMGLRRSEIAHIKISDIINIINTFVKEAGYFE